MKNLAFRNTLLNNWTSALSGVTVPVIRRTSPRFEVTCFHGSYLQGAFNAAEHSHLISMKSTINQWTDSAHFLSFRRKSGYSIYLRRATQHGNKMASTQACLKCQSENLQPSNLWLYSSADSWFLQTIAIFSLWGVERFSVKSVSEHLLLSTNSSKYKLKNREYALFSYLPASPDWKYTKMHQNMAARCFYHHGYWYMADLVKNWLKMNKNRITLRKPAKHTQHTTVVISNWYLYVLCIYNKYVK